MIIRKKDILILDKRPTGGLDDTTLTVEQEYYETFTEQEKKFWLTLHYNGSNSDIFVNGVEIYKFHAKN